MGYNTATVNGGKQIALALQFDDVSTPGKAIKIDKLISGVKHKSTGLFAGCDQIWCWNHDPLVNTWVKYGYRAIDKKTSAWNRYDGSDWHELTDDDVVYPGDTFIYFNANTTGSETITLAGGVKEFTATPEYVIGGGKQRFVCYPWPVAFKLSNITKCYAGGKSTGLFAGCDQIWRWDATPSVNTWVKYGYRAVTKKESQWQKYVNGEWSGVALDDETDVVPAGQGFIFFNADSSKSITLSFKFGEDAE